MKTWMTVTACALLACATPAFAQKAESPTMKRELRNNASPDGAGWSHAKQAGERGAEDGRAPKIEGRASANDQGAANTGNKTGGVNNSATGVGATSK